MSASATLRLAVAARLRERIVGGELEPGSRLNESHLSVELGVSRTPLREALFTLERLGLLHADPQRGFFVAPLSAREVREIYPIGKALDVLAVRSAGPASEESIARMAAHNDRFENERDRPERARLADRDFHRTIVARCPNRRLLALLDDVQFAMERYERVYMSDPKDIDRSVRRHREIVAAFRADDLDRVTDIIGETWDYSARRLILALGEQP